ncbi:hypothetical protein FE810_00965 [Thalassotalea litorea]|uniref:Cadherin domain-containing protein n=1 Tax=Thalassotalea litorea TaxID=2020715 RepID=A0A5R9IPU9_9GAMM|nr:hypothetical protein [Thalassotalea litorea]TLU67550.1 hypothetical protein FE810_00965 [Thalassotalea litorea]
MRIIILFLLGMLSFNAWSNENIYREISSVVNESAIVQKNTVYDATSNTLYSASFERINKVNHLKLKVYSEAENRYRLVQNLDIEMPSDEVTAVEIIDQYLIVFSRRNYHRFSVTGDGHVSFIESLPLPLTLSENFSIKPLKASYFLAYDYYHEEQKGYVLHLDDSGILTKSFDIPIPEKQLRESEQYYFDVLSDQLWIVSVYQRTFKFLKYQLDFENGIGEQLLHQTTVLDDSFDYVNNSLYLTKINSLENLVYVRMSRMEFIFSVNEVVENKFEADTEYTAATASPDNLDYHVEGDKLVRIDWQNLQPVRQNSGIVSIGIHHFLNNKLLMVPDFDANETKLIEFNGNVLRDTEKRVVGGFSGKLPSSLGQQNSFFESETNQLMLFGDNEFFVWNYQPPTNDISYRARSHISQNDTIQNVSQMEYVGYTLESYFFLVRSNTDASSTLLRMQLDGEEFKLKQEVNLTLNGEISAVLQSIIVNDTTIVALHYSREQAFDISICKIEELTANIDCQSSPFLQHQLFNSGSSDYQFVRLGDSYKLLFASKRDIDVTLAHRTTMPILSFDNELEQFVVESEIKLEKDEHETRYLGVDNVLHFDQNNVLIDYNYSSKFYYQFNETSSSWESQQAARSAFNIGQGLQGSHSNDYFIDYIGWAWVFDTKDFGFYRSKQVNNLNSDGYVSYIVVDDSKGFALYHGALPEIRTFEFVDTQPFVDKRTLSSLSVEGVQDQPLHIDFSDHFLNLKPGDITLSLNSGFDETNFNHRNLKWDGKVLSGTLDNDDMFDDEGFASNLRIKAKWHENQIQRSSNFTIKLVNVNDAPDLYAPLTTQYLKANELYQGELLEIAYDPDRGLLDFSVSNLPSGMELLNGRTIQGAIAKKGTYTITVVATERDGLSLTFDIPIVVNASGQPPKAGGGNSGGGITSPLAILALLSLCLLQLSRRKV